MTVILYTIGCPKCNVLEKKLNQKGIKYTIVSNKEQIKVRGIFQLPCLEIDGNLKTFSDAVSWVNGVND